MIITPIFLLFLLPLLLGLFSLSSRKCGRNIRKKLNINAPRTKENHFSFLGNSSSETSREIVTYCDGHIHKTHTSTINLRLLIYGLSGLFFYIFFIFCASSVPLILIHFARKRFVGGRCRRGGKNNNATSPPT